MKRLPIFEVINKNTGEIERNWAIMPAVYCDNGEYVILLRDKWAQLEGKLLFNKIAGPEYELRRKK